MSNPSRYYDGLLARWDQAKWLQDRLGEARAENAALEAECEWLRAECVRLRAALEANALNAESWHGPPPDMGHVRALAVIAKQSRAALGEADDE